MIEGQEDVTWEDWVALADACERSGVEALFRSDHYVSVFGRGRARVAGRLGDDQRARRADHHAAARDDGLARRASATRRCWPSSSTTADHVSGGRIELGLGTGWSEIEHTAYGFPFLSMKERMDVLEEQLEIIHDGHWSDGPFSFKGTYYELEDLQARPQPVQRPHPPLIMGGAAGPRAARLAARYADEYNTVMPTLERDRRAQARTSTPRARRPAASRSRSRS